MAAKKKSPKPCDSDVFTSSDKFERLCRHQIAEMMTEALKAENDKLTFTDNDPRLTDIVCYDFVNAYANCGDPVESAWEVFEEHEGSFLSKAC
jgi:hypothetical protein